MFKSNKYLLFPPLKKREFNASCRKFTISFQKEHECHAKHLGEAPVSQIKSRINQVSEASASLIQPRKEDRRKIYLEIQKEHECHEKHVGEAPASQIQSKINQVRNKSRTLKFKIVVDSLNGLRVKIVGGQGRRSDAVLTLPEISSTQVRYCLSNGYFERKLIQTSIDVCLRLSSIF